MLGRLRSGLPRGQSPAPEFGSGMKITDETHSEHEEMGKDWPQLEKLGPPWPGVFHSTFQMQEDQEGEVEGQGCQIHTAYEADQASLPYFLRSGERAFPKSVQPLTSDLCFSDHSTPPPLWPLSSVL